MFKRLFLDFSCLAGGTCLNRVRVTLICLGEGKLFVLYTRVAIYLRMSGGIPAGIDSDFKLEAFWPPVILLPLVLNIVSNLLALADLPQDVHRTKVKIAKKIAHGLVVHHTVLRCTFPVQFGKLFLLIVRYRQWKERMK